MKIVLAVDKNWGIGKDNEMLFHLKKDLSHFRKTTLGNIVIMGRGTYESIGKALEGRKNLVLSKDVEYKLEDALVFNDVKQVLDLVKDADKEAFVIGGEQIVDLFLPYCDEAIITKIYASRPADTYLHNFDCDPDFVISNQSEVFEEDGIRFSYVTYRRG